VTGRRLVLACAAAAGIALAGAVAAGVSPPASPARATPDEATALARVAEKRLDEWRFGEGRSAVADLVRLAPGAPQTLYLEGYERFLEGDYAGSVQKLEASLAAGPRDASAVNAKELRVLASEAREAVKDHKEERFGHFLVRYPTVDAVLMPYAREALEAAYRALHDDLGFEAELPIRIELYRSPSDLAAVSSLTVAEVSRTGTIALCKWARLMVTSPRALATGYPWLDLRWSTCSRRRCARASSSRSRRCTRRWRSCRRPRTRRWPSPRSRTPSRTCTQRRARPACATRSSGSPTARTRAKPSPQRRA